MHLISLFTAVAVLGLGASAAPALPSTCSYVFSQTAPGRVKCAGTLATFKKTSPHAAAFIAAVPADSVIDCATACKGDSYCNSFGWTAETQTCTKYKRNYGGLLLQADPSSNIAYYSDDCFVKSCIRAPPNTTSSSVAPCTATETVLATTTQFTETASTTLTAVAFTTLDAPVWIETATNYIVQNVTAFDIVTVIRSVFSTITLPETTIITSTSTEVDTVLVTSTISTVNTSISSLYYPLTVNNARIKPTCTGPPVATVTTTSTQTNLAQSIAPTTTTITITSTPEVIISTTTANITTNVPITTETAYFNTSVIVTRTQVVTTTLYAIPVTTTYQTSSILNTVSTTTTAYTNVPTPICPASDGKVWNTQTVADGTNMTISSSWDIACDQAPQIHDVITGGGTTATFYDCVESCAENRADYMAISAMRRRGNSVMYCQAALWDSTTNACQWYSYARPTSGQTSLGLDFAYLSVQA